MAPRGLRLFNNYTPFTLIMLMISIHMPHVVKLEPVTSEIVRSGETKTASQNSAGHRRFIRGQGQLESFSADSTGLGDLEADGNLQKTINKRSLVGVIASSSNIASKGQRAATSEPDHPAAKIARSQPIIVPQPSRADLSRAYLLDRWPNLRAADIHSRRHGVIKPSHWSERGEPISSSSTSYESDEEDQESLSGQRLIDTRIKSLDSILRKNHQPIIIARRTAEELLEPAPFDEDMTEGAESVTFNQNDKQVSTNHHDMASFPLLGEFGSHVSLLTTRKMQPSSRGYSVSSPGYIHKFGAAAKGNEEELSPITEDLLDEAEPVSSSAQILSRYLMNRVEEQMKKADNGEGLSRYGGEFNEDESQDANVATEVVHLDSNYLPRVARATFM